MAAKYEQTYMMNANIGQLCTLIKDPRFASELRLELKSENPEPNCIWYRFHHGVSFTSWGEKITITLVPVNDGSASVTIHSECGMPTQVIDWGKNKKVVNNIFEFINKNIGYFSVPQPTVYQPIAPQSITPQPIAPQPIAPQPALQPEVSQAAASAFCTNCGKPVQSYARFCGSCGAKLG